MNWGNVTRWKDIVDEFVAKYGVVTEADIFAYIALESSGDPDRMNPHDPSFGLGSIEIPVFLQWSDPPIQLNNKTDFLQVFDPRINTQTLTRYASHLKQQFGTHQNWMAAYNQGAGNEAKGLLDQYYVDLWNNRYQQVQEFLAQQS